MANASASARWTLPDFRQRATSKRYAATFPAEYQSFPKEYRAAQERFRRLSEKHARQNVTTTISMMRILKTSSMMSRKKTKHPKRTKRLKKTASRCEQMSRKKPPFRAAFWDKKEERKSKRSGAAEPRLILISPLLRERGEPRERCVSSGEQSLSRLAPTAPFTQGSLKTSR